MDLKLGGVERIVAYYSPANVTVKPSEFEPGSRITLADLEDWPHGAVEAHLAINSPQAEFEAATACVREALVGEPEDRHGESPLRVHVSFEPHNYGPQGRSRACPSTATRWSRSRTASRSTSRTWERQFEAWWTGWREHWSAKGQEEPGEPEPALEDTFIPAGQPDPPDLSYRPPAAVAVSALADDGPCGTAQAD